MGKGERERDLQFAQDQLHVGLGDEIRHDLEFQQFHLQGIRRSHEETLEKWLENALQTREGDEQAG
jgi:hypothetical protein